MARKNLDIIVRRVRGRLNEDVSPMDVIDAIHNKKIVKIHYDDEVNHKTGTRFIEPFAYGLSKAGNPVFRAFQVESGPNGSLRGTPKWKLFRLDRVISWAPTRTTFELTPDEVGWANAYYFNREGDKSMSQVFAIAQIDDHSPIDIERAKTKMLRKGRAFNDRRIEGGLPSGFRKRRFGVRGKKKETLRKNLENGGPTISADKKFADYQKALDTLFNKDNAQQVPGPQDTQTTPYDEYDKDFIKMFPEYFEDEDDENVEN